MNNLNTLAENTLVKEAPNKLLESTTLRLFQYYRINPIEQRSSHLTNTTNLLATFLGLTTVVFKEEDHYYRARLCGNCGNLLIHIPKQYTTTTLVVNSCSSCLASKVGTTLPLERIYTTTYNPMSIILNNISYSDAIVLDEYLNNPLTRERHLATITK